MSTLRKRFTAATAIVVALSITPALAACAGNPIEGIIEGVTGGDVDLGGPGLPQGFPTADLPLYQGEVLYGAGVGNAEGKIWNVTVRVPSVAALTDIKAQLEAAGYTAQPITETADGGTAAFSGPKYGVLVVVSKDDQGFIANYTVTPVTQ